MEIERKWMVAGWPASDEKTLPLLCTEYQEQGYLHTQAPIVRVRLQQRGSDIKYVLCFKSEGLLVRKEIEIEVGKEDFARLSDLIGQPLIRKERRIYALPEGLELEVNLVDKDLPTEFMYAEVEFGSEEQALSWNPSACGLGEYLSDDVTGQPGQSMSAFWAKTRS